MKITVLIPVYNTLPDALIEAVYSIIRQDDFTEHDIVIINDASDNYETLKAIEFLCSVCRRIKLLNLNENSGTAVALNQGHKMVDTEFIAIMGSDDVSHKSRFKIQLDYLKAHPDTDVLGTNLFSYQNDDISRKSLFTSKHLEIPAKSMGNWVVNHGTVIYRKSAVDSVGGYNPTYRRAQDVELWGRMMAAGFKFRNISHVLYAWRRF